MDNLAILFNAPVFSVQLLIDGILIGAVFVLAAYGMALVWGVMNIINIAQGDFVMLGGFVTWWLSIDVLIWLGIPAMNFDLLWLVAVSIPEITFIEFVKPAIHPFFGLPISFLLLFLVGWVTYLIVICRVVDKDLFISILATFGVSIFLQQVMNVLFTADVQTAQSGLGTTFLFDGAVAVSQIKVVAFVVAIGLAASLVLFMKRSKLGQAIRATAQNARAARIMGIDTDKVYAATYSLNAAICGAAGALVVMIWVVQPFVGLAYTVRSFMIVIVAGLGNLFAVAAAGLGLGVAENFAGFILGAEFQMAFIFSLLVVLLVWRSIKLRRRREVLK